MDSNNNSNNKDKPELSQEEIEDIEFYLEEGEKLINDLEKSFNTFLSNPDDDENLKISYRMAHTIKGNSGFLELDDLVAIAHRMEDVLNLLYKREISFKEEMKVPLKKGIDTIRELFSQLSVNYTAHLKDQSIIFELEQLKVIPTAAEKKADDKISKERSAIKFASVENYLLAQAGDRVFGISRNLIRETRPKLAVTTIPLCEHFFSQVAFLNGNFIPVIEVYRFFLKEPSPSSDSIFIIIECFSLTYCLKFEKIVGFLAVDGKDIIPTNPLIYQDPHCFSQGLTQKDDLPVDIMDVKKIIRCAQEE
ncbi:chemotaxis protein CheW [Candidatus Riflebacteria bacterium]